MAFISARLLAEPPLISLFDDDIRCCSLSLINPELTRSEIPKTPTPLKNWMDFAEQSTADKLYAKIYQKNLLKFLATGGLADKKRDIDVTVNGPTIPSLIDEQLSINGCSDNLTDPQEFIVEEVPAVDYYGGSSREFEFEHGAACQEEGELLLCLSDETTQSPLNREENNSGWRRRSLMEEFVSLSDEVTKSTTSISQDDFDMRRRAKAENNRKFIPLSNEAEPSLNSGEEEGSAEGPANGGSEAVRPVYVSPGVNSTTISNPPGDLEKSVDTEDCTLALSDLNTPNYIAGESSSEEGNSSRKASPSSTCPPSSADSFDMRSTTRRLVRINLPDDTLHTMQEDSRFDGVCHAWVRRPDFCKWGVNCDFSHEYPPVLAEKYGMIAVYVKPNGKEVKNVAEFLKLEDAFIKTQWSKLDEGAKIHSPGCYKEHCRAFLRNECTHGVKCWYRHPKTVVERGIWVTADVRKLADGKNLTYDELSEKGKVDINDGFCGDQQSGIARTGRRPPPSKHRGIPPENTPPWVYKGVNAVPGRKILTVAKIPTELSSSEEINEVRNKLSSNGSGVCYPRSSSRLARLTPASSGQIPPTLPADIKLTTCWTTVFPKPSPTAVVSTDSNKDYNYWGDEKVAPDEADYWNNTPPIEISRLASREQAFVVEAMTYKQLFKGESRKEIRKDLHKPFETPRSASGFVMPTGLPGTHRESGRRKILEENISIAYAKQEKEEKENKFDIPDMKREKAKTSEGLSCGKQIKIHVRELNGGNETTSSGSDWTKSLQAMLAQRCEPTRWKADGKRGTLIEF